MLYKVLSYYQEQRTFGFGRETPTFSQLCMYITFGGDEVACFWSTYQLHSDQRAFQVDYTASMDNALAIVDDR